MILHELFEVVGERVIEARTHLEFGLLDHFKCVEKLRQHLIEEIIREPYGIL